MSSFKNLAGRTAIVTGTSRGIGPHIARALAREGMRVVLAARGRDELEQVAAEIAATGGATLAVPTDVRNRTSLVALVAAATRRFGEIDVLVNNAGGDPLRPFDEYAAADVDDVLGVNLSGPIELTRLLLPGMLERGRGHIVNISSLAGSMGFPFTEVYAAAKDGLVGFSRVLRADYRSRGVSSSALILGAVFGDGQGQRSMDELGISIPRMARAMASTPATVADAVVQAIKRDRAIVVVMPGPGGVLKSLMDAFPELGPHMNDMGGATALVKRLAALRAQTPVSTPATEASAA
ncbi:MAG TPA: SDR family oxidoreductase [Chloroflexota bacterium]|nr:SDR family oxidoreductase [Chloroflexota bacterium]